MKDPNPTMEQRARRNGARFTGRTAVVTGAASAIGAATAERLARGGAAVVLADIADERGEAVAGHITEDGGRAGTAPSWTPHGTATRRPSRPPSAPCPAGPAANWTGSTLPTT